jgi:hypothetical protein
MSEQIPKSRQTYRRRVAIGIIGAAAGVGALAEATVLISPQETQAMNEHSACQQAQTLHCEKGDSYPTTTERAVQTASTFIGLGGLATGIMVAGFAIERLREERCFEQVVAAYSSSGEDA